MFHHPLTGAHEADRVGGLVRGYAKIPSVKSTFRQFTHQEAVLDEIGIEHLKQRGHVLFRAHVLQGRKVQNQIMIPGGIERHPHDGRAVVDREGAEIRDVHALGATAQVTC